MSSPAHSFSSAVSPDRTLALGFWGEQSFGDLNPRDTLRLIISSPLFITLGFQIILSSFFPSVLGLGTRDKDPS